MFRDLRSKGKISVLRFAAIAIAVTTGCNTAGLAASATTNAPHGDLKDQTSVTTVTSVPESALYAEANVLQLSQKKSEIEYNLKTPPILKQSEDLQGIVDEVVEMAADKGLLKKPLSVTLIDVKTGEIAGYRQQTRRYPASVIKMFWMTTLYAEIEANLLNEGYFNQYIAKMIKESDNDAASLILDQITGTRSQPKLSKPKFETWLNSRKFVNRFFRNAGYSRINITQKVYPVYSINLPAPKGIDLQMRGNTDSPIRNKITSYHAARLLYEICVMGQAVSPSASQKMSEWLKRDLRPEVWGKQSDGFNPIRGFLGEGLADADVEFYSKAGWASGTRNDAAFIKSKDGKTAYILTVFGDSRAYAEDGKIFPKISRLVFDRMNRRTLSNGVMEINPGLTQKPGN